MMKLEGEKCADETKAADAFCGVCSLCPEPGATTPGSHPPPPASVHMGGNFLAKAAGKHGKGPGSKRLCFVELGCFKNIPGDSDVL